MLVFVVIVPVPQIDVVASPHINLSQVVGILVQVSGSVPQPLFITRRTSRQRRDQPSEPPPWQSHRPQELLSTYWLRTRLQFLLEAGDVGRQTRDEERVIRHTVPGVDSCPIHHDPVGVNNQPQDREAGRPDRHTPLPITPPPSPELLTVTTVGTPQSISRSIRLPLDCQRSFSVVPPSEDDQVVPRASLDPDEAQVPITTFVSRQTCQRLDRQGWVANLASTIGNRLTARIRRP